MSVSLSRRIHAVEELRREGLTKPAAGPPRGSSAHLEPLTPFLQQDGQQLRRVLQVRVHRDDRLAARRPPAPRQRRLVAEVAAERQVADAAVAAASSRSTASVPSREPSST